MKFFKKILKSIVSMSGVAIFFFIWVAAYLLNGDKNKIFPSPIDVCNSLMSDFGPLMKNMSFTLLEAFAGLLISVALAFLLTFFMYKSENIYSMTYPLLTISQSIPTIAISPLLVMTMGYGTFTKILVVVINCFFPMTISLLNGIKSADKDRIQLLRTMGATKNQIFRYVLIPSSRSYFFAGFKISVSYSLISAVIAEWIGGDVGIGIYMLRVKKSYEIDKLLAAVVVLCVSSLLTIEIIRTFEKKFLKKGLLFLLAASALCVTVFPRNENKEQILNEKVSFVLDYTPNTNHTGIYVARALGYFEQQGLDVDIQQPPQDGASSLVLSGKADFGIDFQDQLAPLLDNCNVKDEIVVLASILQHNTAAIISKKEKGISCLADLNHKTFATSVNPIEEKMLKSLLDKEIDINFVSMDVSDVITTISTQVDAMCCYYAWDGVAAELIGEKLNTIFYKDINSTLDFYTPVIISSRKYVESNPSTTKKFMRAVCKGYEYAVNNPEDSARILCESVPELSKQIVLESQKWISKEYTADAGVWGKIDQKRWNSFYRWLYENGITENKLYEKEVLLNEWYE